MAKPAKKPTELTVGPVRISYAYVWEPREAEEGKRPKYETMILVPESETKIVARLNKAIDAAVEAGKKRYGEEWATKNKSSFKRPLKEGNEEKPGEDIYEDMLYFNAWSYNAPEIVDRQVQPILKQSEVYSGCWANISLEFYPYDNEGRGVGVMLGNIQKVRDDEKLAGGRSAAEDFVAMDDDEDDI